MSPDRQEAPEGGWSSLKVDELKEQLEARDLPKSGKKDELVARLEEFEAEPADETSEAADRMTSAAARGGPRRQRHSSRAGRVREARRPLRWPRCA